MASSFARPGTQKELTAAEAKARFLDLIRDGLKVREACNIVSRSEETYRYWMKDDAEFKAAIQNIRAAAKETKDTGRPQVPDFETFCRDWLKQPLYPHQLRILDVIEGRPPRDMHESMSFEQGYDNRVLINVPIEHAKSTTFTVNYVVWLIHKNPDVRVVIVSKGLKLAQDFLYEIKLKLTSPIYREMHMRFAPRHVDGAIGWRDPDGSWSNDRIYVKGKNEEGIQKDPTVQAMGLKGQIYGRRADVVILDDIVDSKNVREVDFQTRVLNRDIDSRLPSDQEGGGLLLILGTRVAPMDLYRSLLDVYDGDERRVWTYLRQPAVLDYGTGDSAGWTTLWPWKWNGASLSKRRRDAGWNLIYQQLDVDDDMTFKAEAVNAAINGMRFPGLGPMEAGPSSRPGGTADLYRVLGVDPAASGNTAMIVAGLDRMTGKRWVIDGWNQPNATAEQIIKQFKNLTEVYQPHEWVIEQNAFQRFITQLPELVEFARSRGVKITPHYTTANKFDSDWGVQTMAPLFDSCVTFDAQKNIYAKVPHAKALIELPSTRQNAWVNDLVQQLTIWQPEGMAQKQKTDMVMALWFTHIAFSRVLRRSKPRQTHLSTPFQSPSSRGRQTVISLSALRREKQLLEGVG